MNVSSIPFESIPGQSRLFLDYLRDPKGLKTYYPNAANSVGDVAAYGVKALAGYTTDRDELCDILVSINDLAGVGEETFKNIDLLRRSDTVAVLTGQQAGLFSGPLYTIYKVLSAVKMARELTAEGVNAVPVFWAATEDHDLEEVSIAHFVSASGEMVSAKYEGVDGDADLQVGEIVIDDSIHREIDQLFDQLPNSEFSADAKNILEGSWQPGSGFGAAFLRTMAKLVGKYGVIFVDPTDDRLRRLAGNIFVGAVQRSDQIVESVIARSAELANDGYHAQVNIGPDYFPIFLIDHDRKRRSLKKIGDGLYRVKGGKQDFTREELQRMAEEKPEQFSPGVMLRPVVQDYLFPTVCYVGGAAELAYFAQNSVVYASLGRSATPGMLRQSFTVVESKHRRALEKLGLSFTDLFEGRTVLGERLGAAILSPEKARVFAEAEERINTELNRLDQQLSPIDPTLVENLAKRRRKILYHIEALRRKTLAAVTRNDETFRRRLDGLFASVLPNGALQERTLNVFSFIDRFGPNFVDWIYDAIDLDDRGHRIIDI